MPLRLGLLLYPAFALLALRGGKSPGSVLKRIGATSPETAVHAAGVGLTDAALVADAVRSGTLIRLPDGRCYVDMRVFRRRRAWSIGALIAIGVVVTAIGVWLAW